MPIEINGKIFHTSPIFLDREEAAIRFEICGGCVHNKDGICSILNVPARSLIYMANSGCPVEKWGPEDISEKLANILGFGGFGCCG